MFCSARRSSSTGHDSRRCWPVVVIEQTQTGADVAPLHGKSRVSWAEADDRDTCPVVGGRPSISKSVTWSLREEEGLQLAEGASAEDGLPRSARVDLIGRQFPVRGVRAAMVVVLKDIGAERPDVVEGDEHRRVEALQRCGRRGEFDCDEHPRDGGRRETWQR